MAINIDWTLVYMIVAALFTFFQGWALWSAKKQFASAAEVTALETRVQLIENHIEKAPDEKAFHELSLAMSTLSGELKVANERTTGLKDTVNRLNSIVQRQEEHLLNK